MTWNEDHAKGTLENHSSQKHQSKGFEEERNSLEKERGLIDIQEDTDLHIDRCQGLNDEVTTTVSSERLWKPPITRKDGFLWMDISRTKLELV
jgi:hypothetical protein